MKKSITLDNLSVGETGTVKEINMEKVFKNRIYDFGISEGTDITPLFSSPFGNPRAYAVNGMIFALRKSDAKCIVTETEVYYG